MNAARNNKLRQRERVIDDRILRISSRGTTCDVEADKTKVNGNTVKA